MLGWRISVYRQPSETSPERVHLASWTGSLGALDWVHRLVAAERAVRLEFNGGYPCRFGTTASVLLPLFTPNALPSDSPVAKGNGAWNIHIDRDEVAQCSPDEQLLIEAWDQS